MSEHEFDRYLAILSGLLRLSPKQRHEIASELRDHLEERLAELLEQGTGRAKAIEIALEEFGDTAGLAAEFVNIFRQQRRRRVMRMTAGTVAALAAVVMISMALWPEGGAVPVRAVAQDDQSAATNPFEPATDDRPIAQPPSEVEQNNLRAQHQLSKRIDAELVDQPLSDVLKMLAFEGELQMHVKQSRLDDVGTGLDMPIRLSLKDVRIEMVLDLVLEQADLVYMVKDGIVIVTTLDDLDAAAEVRVYNCRDLLHVGLRAPFMPRPARYGPTPASRAADKSPPRYILTQFGGFGGDDENAPARPNFGNVPVVPEQKQRAEQLIEMITTSVDPDSWNRMGSYGTIVEYDGLLVVNHNPRIHRRVEQVLNMLRDAASKAPGSTVRVD